MTGDNRDGGDYERAKPSSVAVARPVFVLRNIEIGFVKRQRLDEVGVPLQYLAHLSRNSPVARKIRGQEYAFGECGERAGLRHDRVGKVASHGIGDAAQTAQSDAVGPLGMFEFLNGLPWRAQVLADFRQSQAERFADRRNPSA